MLSVHVPDQLRFTTYKLKAGVAIMSIWKYLSKAADVCCATPAFDVCSVSKRCFKGVLVVGQAVSR